MPTRSPGPTPSAGEHPRRAIDPGLQLGVGEPTDLAVLALPGDRRAVGIGRSARVDGGRGVVESAAGPPARPFHPTREVHHLERASLPGEADVVGGGAPEPGGIARGVHLERCEVALAGRSEKAGQPAVGASRDREGRQAASGTSRPKIGHSPSVGTSPRLTAGMLPRPGKGGAPRSGPRRCAGRRVARAAGRPDLTWHVCR